MCKDCLIQPFVDRADTCLDSGAYLANHRTCKQCGTRGHMHSTQRTVTEETEEEDFDEETTYHHMCTKCSHLIAEHFYSFNVGKENGLTVQNYIMSCALCGKGGDRRVVDDSAADSAVSTQVGETKATPTIITMVGMTSSSMLKPKPVTVQHTQAEDDDDWD